MLYTIEGIMGDNAPSNSAKKLYWDIDRWYVRSLWHGPFLPSDFKQYFGFPGRPRYLDGYHGMPTVNTVADWCKDNVNSSLVEYPDYSLGTMFFVDRWIKSTFTASDDNQPHRNLTLDELLDYRLTVQGKSQTYGELIDQRKDGRAGLTQTRKFVDRYRRLIRAKELGICLQNETRMAMIEAAPVPKGRSEVRTDELLATVYPIPSRGVELIVTGAAALPPERPTPTPPTVHRGTW
jgi:hypothetical protein